MHLEEKVAAKALVFGLGMPLFTLPLIRVLPVWAAWGIAAVISCELFHWLPPRVHDVTPARSAAIAALSGLSAATVVLLVDRL